MNRETPIEQIFDKSDQLQYDEGDAHRIKESARLITSAVINLIDSLGYYRDELAADIDEGSATRIADERKKLIEHWASTQMALSSIAFAFRFEGDVAYNRLVYACTHEGETADMTGL